MICTDRRILIGFIIVRGAASSCNSDVRRPTLCHDVSHYAALYAYYDNNNDSDDIACDDGTDDADPRLATVMNFIIASPPPATPSALSFSLSLARARVHTHVEKSTRALCSRSCGIRATAWRSFPF